MNTYIKLTQNKVALVDEHWIDYLNQWKWYAVYMPTNNRWYAERTDEFGNKIKMHRVIADAPANKHVDHKDDDGLNNTENNLRVCTRSQNMHNQGKHRNNTSGYKGVNWNKNSRKWEAKIRINNKRIFLGLFEDVIDAALAYDKASKEYHGRFGRTNF